MFNDPVAATARPRRRFWLWMVGLPVAAAVLAGVGWLAKTAGGLQHAMADADRLDPGWRLDDLEAARYTPPADRDGAAKVLAVKRLTPGNWLDPKLRELLQDLSPPARLNDQQAAAVRALLQAAGPAVAEARTLIDTPRGRHVLNYTPDWIGTLLQCQDNREAAAMLVYDVLDRAQAGDLDGALVSVRACLHAGSSLGDEPFLISQLVRIACQAIAINLLERTLAQGEPGEAALAAVQARLAAVEPEPLFLYGVRGERAGGNSFFENVRSGKVPTGNLIGTFGLGGGVPGYAALLLRVPGVMTTQHAAYLRYLNEMVEVAKRPPEEWAAPLAAMDAKARTLPFLTRMLVPAVTKVAEAARRNHAQLRAAVVAVAAERYRRQKGQWPASMDELVVAGLIPAVPRDPFDGQPLRFKRTADGLVIYSPGPDGKDDGGTVLRGSPAPANWDVGVQVWDVTARRGPPPAPKPPNPPDDGPAPGGPPQ